MVILMIYEIIYVTEKLLDPSMLFKRARSSNKLASKREILFVMVLKYVVRSEE